MTNLERDKLLDKFMTMSFENSNFENRIIFDQPTNDFLLNDTSNMVKVSDEIRQNLEPVRVSHILTSKEGIMFYDARDNVVVNKLDWTKEVISRENNTKFSHRVLIIDDVISIFIIHYGSKPNMLLQLIINGIQFLSTVNWKVYNLEKTYSYFNPIICKNKDELLITGFMEEQFGKYILDYNRSRGRFSKISTNGNTINEAKTRLPRGKWIIFNKLKQMVYFGEGQTKIIVISIKELNNLSYNTSINLYSIHFPLDMPTENIVDCKKWGNKNMVINNKKQQQSSESGLFSTTETLNENNKVMDLDNYMEDDEEEDELESSESEEQDQKNRNSKYFIPIHCDYFLIEQILDCLLIYYDKERGRFLIWNMLNGHLLEITNYKTWTKTLFPTKYPPDSMHFDEQQYLLHFFKWNRDKDVQDFESMSYDENDDEIERESYHHAIPLFNFIPKNYSQHWIQQRFCSKGQWLFDDGHSIKIKDVTLVIRELIMSFINPFIIK